MKSINANCRFCSELSWFLLSVMVIFCLQPGFVYGTTIYTGGKGETGNTNRSGAEYSISHGIKKGQTSKKALKVGNTANSGNDADKGKGSTSSSNAVNYTMGIGAEVNPQTGQLGINFNNVKLDGVNDATSVDFGLSNGGAAKRIYNLPAGWNFNLDYIDTTVTPHVLHYGSTGNYTQDTGNKYPSYFIDKDGNKVAYYSGLRYAANKAIKFEVLTPDEIKNLPEYCKSLGCYYRLLAIIPDPKDSDNTITKTEYFGKDGKLLVQDDEPDGYGNHIIYTYEKINPDDNFNVFNSELKTITDSYNHKITVSYEFPVSGEDIKIAMPVDDNGVQQYAEYKFAADDNSITVRDLTGLTTTIKQRDGKVYEIDYPTGAKVVYLYDTDAIPYYWNGATELFSGIKSVMVYPDGNTSATEPAMETDYNYGSKGFTGYGDAIKYNPSVDSLTESNDKSYYYTTTVTQKISAENGGDITTAQTFNFLHLPVSTTVTQGAKSFVTTTNYIGDYTKGQTPPTHPFPDYDELYCNNSLPAHVTTEINKKVIDQVDTDYNNYAQPVSVTQYTNGKPTLEKTLTYYPYNPDSSSNFSGKPSYCQLKSSTVTDYIDGTTTETENSLNSDGKYVKTSVTSMGADARESDVKSVDDCGRTQEIAYSDPNSSGCNGPASTDLKTLYTRSGNNDLTIETTDAMNDSKSTVIDTASDQIIKETDSIGNVTSYKYADNGLDITKTFPDGSTVEVIKHYKCQGGNENTVTKIYSSGLTETEYVDGLGRETRETVKYPDGKTQTVMTKTYYDNRDNGKLKYETDLEGHTTTYVYHDIKGRLTDSTDYLGNITHIDYNDENLTSTTSVIDKESNGVENPIPLETKYYDSQGNVTKTIDYTTSGDGNDSMPESISTYNGKNEKIKDALELSSISENGVSEGTPLMSTEKTYDLNGKQLTAKLDAYDKNSNGPVITAHSSDTRDLFGNLISKEITFDSVDPSQHIIGKSDSNANAVGSTTDGFPCSIESETKTYDNDGRPMTLTNQLGQTIAYTYYANGKIKTMTDFQGNTFSYTYNNMGNMLSMKGAGIDEENTYYPGDDNSMSAGKIKTKFISYPDGKNDTVSYTYDGRGNLASKTMNGKTMYVTYDKYERVSTVTDFAGVTTTCTYNDNGTKNGEADDDVIQAGNLYGSVTYTYCTKDGDGPLFGEGTTVKEADYSNGAKVVYHYYNEKSKNINAPAPKLKAPQLKSIETFNSGGELMNGTYYTYDNQGRVITLGERSETDPNNSNCNNVKKYTYNAMDQLTEEDVWTQDCSGILGVDLQTTEYYYDINGNITNRVTTDVKTGQITSNEYTYNPIDELTKLIVSQGDVGTQGMSVVKTETFDYDKNGNMIDIKDGNGSVLKDFSYNTINQLVEYTDNTGTDVKYDYNAESLRKDKYYAGNFDGRLMFYYSGDKITNESDAKGHCSTYLMPRGNRILRAVEGKAEWYVSNGKDVVGMAKSDGSGYVQDASGKDIVNNYSPYGSNIDLNKIVNS